MEPENKLLLFRDLRSYGIAFTREWIAKLVDRGEFPPPVAIGSHRIAWRESDVLRWIASRPPARVPTRQEGGKK